MFGYVSTNFCCQLIPTIYFNAVSMYVAIQLRYRTGFVNAFYILTGVLRQSLLGYCSLVWRKILANYFFYPIPHLV